MIREYNIEKTRIAGIGFDATCSMVVLDTDFQPISISPSGEHVICLGHLVLYMYVPVRILAKSGNVQ